MNTSTAATSADFETYISTFLQTALQEDHGPGDYSSASVIPREQMGKATLHLKEPTVMAGLELAKRLLLQYDSHLQLHLYVQDGQKIEARADTLQMEGSLRSILGIERLLLNCIQHMSAIASQTRRYVERISDYPTKLLDTRKTAPTLRFMDKWAVRIGGGHNHRFGLYDMIMLKDNHVDAAGGIRKALEAAHRYRETYQLAIPIELETRNFEEIMEAMRGPVPDIIMFDNFSVAQLPQALDMVGQLCETEASGGIAYHNIRDFAASGVDGLSTSALTRPGHIPDMSLKIAS